MTTCPATSPPLVPARAAPAARAGRPDRAALLDRVARAAAVWTDRQARLRRAEMPIPAGVAYLAQLLAHDLPPTRPDAVPTPGAAAIRAALRLDSLYGDGPAADPHLYAPAPDGGAPEGRFRMGALPGGPAGSDHWLAPRDDGPWRARRPVLADPLNDSHFLISQLTLVWMRFHNAVLEALGPAPDAAARARRFDRARAAVQATWLNVIEADVLPGLCGPAPSPAVPPPAAASSRRPARGPVPAPTDPATLVQVLLRACHALPRHDYRLRPGHRTVGLDALRDFRFGAGRAPFDSWSPDWGLFFDLAGGRAANRTAFLPGAISALTFCGRPVAALDQSRAEALGLGPLAAPFPAVVPAAALSCWLTAIGAEARDARALTRDPPPALLLQLEAHRHGGLLGPVGAGMLHAGLAPLIAAARAVAAPADPAVTCGRFAEVLQRAGALPAVP